MAATFATALFHRFFDVRWPIGRIEGVVTSADAVYVAEWYDARVYKFDFSGNLLRWVNVQANPISITRDEDAILLHHGDREWPLKEPGFEVRDPNGVTATVERTWWGHPVLVVNTPQGVRRASLQPWYLTLIQGPYPGTQWVFVMMVFLAITLWLKKHR